MRIVRAGLALALVAASLTNAGGASAQFFPGDDYRRGPPRDYYDDRYDRRGGWDRDDRWDRRDDRRWRERERYGSRRGGAICVTSRGACRISLPLVSGAACRCDIPGFGPKRGNVQ